MIVQDQSEVVDWLAGQSSDQDGPTADCIETPISPVFLIGDRAYKLKRAVKLPYADFSTSQIRLRSCEKELDLNLKTSPEIYVRVRRITRESTGLTFDGTGELVDAVVEMNRFDQENILDHLALHEKLTSEIMSELAREILIAHRKAPPVQQDGIMNIQNVLDINRAGFHESEVFSNSEIERIDTAFRTGLQRLAPILKKRADGGSIKLCHGDLHLRNICMFDGRPQLFDCIDFSDQLATVDVLYDLAFLAMDLWHRGMQKYANLVVNHYLDGADEEDGYACLPYFISLRAAVRAHVLATQSIAAQLENAQEKKNEARSYYELALSLLRPQQPRLIAIGGLSGSGKSTLGAEIAPRVGPAPGARLIESDRTRKAMFNVAPESRLPDDAYAPEVSDKVYALMSERAANMLQAGCSIVADAVFDVLDRRRMMENAAEQTAAPFCGIWLETKPETLRHRVNTRPKTASDATQDVLEKQLARGVDSLNWQSIDTSRNLDETNRDIRRILGV